MIKYADLVEYIKEEHVNWNTDLFDVLRGFFEKYSLPAPTHSNPPAQQELIVPQKGFKEPKEREYTIEDVLLLFSQ